jgi:peptidoglycan/xylan/chitin deacetylase (PgdA/CDA1 family)
MNAVNVPILMYHSIENASKETVMRGMHVPPKRFKFQMWLLKLLGYKGLSMRDLKPYLSGKKTGKVVGITFDDGYRNNLENAAPILNKYGFGATCYIVSDCLGMSNVWDLKKGIDQKPLMSEAQVREWLSNGLDIGGHTKTHADLSVTDNNVSLQEIEQCRHDLERKFNIDIVDFCYPFGRYNKNTLEIVNKAGYQTATTMIRGSTQLVNNPLELKRIPVTHHTLPHLFLVKLLTNYENRR